MRNRLLFLHDTKAFIQVANVSIYLFIHHSSIHLSITPSPIHFIMYTGEAFARNVGQTVPQLYQRGGRPAGDATTALQRRRAQDGVFWLYAGCAS